MPTIVTLLTDFGTADGYVAEMKGTLLSLAAHVTVVDVSHDLPAHDVEAARLAVARYWMRFPPGTVHVVVVDPGVGGARAALAAACEGRFLVGPDNGVLSPALLHRAAQCVRLPVPATASPTFHGRDVFAPAAAQLASGVALDALGEPFHEPVLRRMPEAVRRSDGAVGGIVIAVDRFGNLLTNLIAHRADVLELAGQLVPMARTYADVEEGALVALTGSAGLVEIAVRDGSAALRLGMRRGDAVVLRPSSGRL
jgi:S-adenosylmethionine hydrolase